MTTLVVHWTQFPADSVTDRSGGPVDWLDHKAAHQAVSRLFAPQLPGESESRRANAGILYRLDARQNLESGAAEATVLVQSLVAPELVPADHRTITVPPSARVFAPGTRVAFRVAVNPVMRTTRHYTSEAKKTVAQGSNEANRVGPRPTGHRKQTARVVPADELAAWLERKLSPALQDLEIVDHRRDKSRSGRHIVVVDRIDGSAVVEDAAALTDLLTVGVGRAKAYGCGLLTVMSLVP